MATKYNINVVRGDPFSSTVATTNDNDSPFNLSGYSISGGIRYRYTEPDLVNFEVAVNDPPNSGVLTMGLTANETRGLPVSQCVYYLKAIPSGSNVPIPLLEGYAYVYPL